ncbi:hypothetical protein BU25DRAFT_258454 [Macroventuria anomochaeta]|uniref:Uncharacterized protein n=1 Tax=Macroventuria anomochaeta TaxID=301207 RepID=A0ACB6S8T6_9PLEO|nr:uncharacterized protein BU25DRAFT_258454 [Macroventuria anomochaeta]KAF2630469.1 hypothetical protein BU25DRAFT_258454 [Macroventuria anomochaeta]
MLIRLQEGKRLLWSSVGFAQPLTGKAQAPRGRWGAFVHGTIIALALPPPLNTLINCKHKSNTSSITHQISKNICKSPVAQWSPRPTVTARRHIGRLEVRSFPGELSFLPISFSFASWKFFECSDAPIRVLVRHQTIRLFCI